MAEKLKTRLKMYKWRKEHPWWQHYNSARTRCVWGKYRKRIKFLMSLMDFKELWFRDRAWLLKKPNIDRIDNAGNYIKENCRFIEFSENTRLGKEIQWRSKYPIPIYKGREKEYRDYYRKQHRKEMRKYQARYIKRKKLGLVEVKNGK